MKSSLKNLIIDEAKIIHDIINKAKYYDRQKIIGFVEYTEYTVFHVQSFKIGNKAYKMEQRGGAWQSGMGHGGEARVEIFERLLKAGVTYIFLSDEPVDGTREMQFHLETVNVHLFTNTASSEHRFVALDWKKDDIRFI